jgi:DedD protein
MWRKAEFTYTIAGGNELWLHGAMRVPRPFFLCRTAALSGSQTKDPVLPGDAYGDLEMSQEEQAQDDSVKKRAFKRVAFAGVLALVAAIGLTMLSRSNKPTPRPQLQTVGEPAVPVAVPEATEPPLVSAEPEVPPESDASPTVAPPPPPQVINPPQQEAPRKAAKPLVTSHSEETELAVKPVQRPSAQGSQPPSGQELVATSKESVREALAKFNDVPAIQPAESRAVAQKVAEAALPPQVTKKIPEKASEKALEKAPEKNVDKTQPPASAQAGSVAARGYAVQLGVFSNPANATQMQEKLSQHGIKSYTETRLHVGPFQGKAEAEAAQVKLRGLGISAVVVSLTK